MSLDPSYSSPPIVFNSHPPTVESELKLLKPGKRFGIIALWCGAEPFLVILLYFLMVLPVSFGLIDIPLGHLWDEVFMCLFIISPSFTVFGIVYGIWGLNTRGRFYAYTGLVLSVLYCLLVFASIMYIVLSVI